MRFRIDQMSLRLRSFMLPLKDCVAQRVSQRTGQVQVSTVPGLLKELQFDIERIVSVSSHRNRFGASPGILSLR